MKILYAASEAVPFCKTGGLADVAGSLPAALAAQGAEVAVVLVKPGVLGMQTAQAGSGHPSGPKCSSS